MRTTFVLLACASCADAPSATCSYESEPVAIDDASALGFSVQDEQRAIVGRWVGDLTYHGGGSLATATPSAGTTRVVLEWIALASEARHVRGTPPAGAGRLACDEYLESDLELRVATNDGMFDEAFVVAFQHDGGPKRGTIIDVRDHEFAGFHAALVSPEQFETRGSDLWVKMEADAMAGFLNVWATEAPVVQQDGTTTGGGPAPMVVTFTATRQ